MLRIWIRNDVNDAWLARVMFLCLLVAVPLVWFSAKVMHTANRAAGAFIRANDTYYDNWVFDPPLVRRYTVFAVFTSSPCSILDGDVVEASVSVHDASRTTAVMYTCFSGWWWRKSIPSIYITDVGSRFQYMPPRGFP
jgi:hypothetical protein